MDDLKPVMKIIVDDDFSGKETPIYGRKITVYSPDDISKNHPINIYLMNENELVIYTWEVLQITPKASNEIIIKIKD